MENQKPHIYYQTRRHGCRKYSIDEVQKDGQYVCQVAFWFKDRESAEKRLTVLVEQDNGHSARFVESEAL